MSEHNRVVNLRARAGERVVSLPPALMRLRDASGQSFSAVLSEFFDHADDALFSMAETAGSNQDQTAFFEAMRELRLRRKSMSLSMAQWVARAFNEIGTFDPRPRPDNLVEVDQESLSLVGHGDHEQQVAIDNLISKLRSACPTLIGMLVARIHHLLPDLNLKERQMPLSPEVICGGLHQACDDLDIDIRAKIVVLKLFDKLLINKLETLYQDANKLLVSDGVLPQMTRPPSRRRAPPASPQRRVVAGSSSTTPEHFQPGYMTENPGTDMGGATFSELSHLLHQSPGLGAMGMAAPGSAGGGIAIEKNELMHCLADLQGRVPATGYDGGGGGETPGFTRLTTQLDAILKRHAHGLNSLKQVDADVINLVTMLFDFILEDRQLPAHMKALIGRLQIPILKVALLDRSFFNRGGHPARKLLNELATAGIGWNRKAEGQRDPLRDKVESVVDRLLTEFTDNVELFQDVLNDFTHFMDLDSRRRELVEQRLRDAEEGRARQERARTVANETLAPLQVGHSLPAPVTQLLEQPWSRYMQFLYLREGEDSEAWRMAVTTAEKLVWSVDPQPVEPETRADLLRELPVIVDELRRGLHSISWDPFESDSLIRDLELEHVNTLQQLALRAPRTDSELEATDPGADAKTTHVPETKAATSDTDAASIASAPADTGQSELLEAAGPDEVAPEASTLGEQGDQAQAPIVEDIESQWQTMARKLRVGSWVEVVSETQKMRCKLAAVIKATGKYIFVNRTGAKIAEYDLDQVAAAMECGEIGLLDDGLIFDRALESIIDNLRHSRRD